MQTKEHDIKIRIIFKDNIVSSKLVTLMLDDIEDITFKSEENDLKEILKKSFIPNIIKDAALYRFYQHKGDSLILDSTKKGSFIIEATVAGVAYWILQNTIGETFKDAWKETDMNKTIKNFFLSKRNQDDNLKAKEIKSNISRNMQRYRHSHNRYFDYDNIDISITTEITYEECTTINIEVVEKDYKNKPPKFSDLINTSKDIDR